MSIPSEYLNTTVDFGFTAVDDPDDSTSPQAPVVNTQEISAPILERIQNLENNMAEMLNILTRIEQASTPNLDTDEYKQLIEEDVREKLKKVESMIMPLLTNLLKDADKKDFIRWPNRKPIIEGFIEKLLSVTRS